MAKPRNPLGKARIEGRDKVNAGRFKDRAEPKANGPLGTPPKWIADTDQCKAKAAWLLFQNELPWLNQSHRTLVGMASNIQGRIMAGQEVGVQAMNLLRQMLGQMGATPADATKVTVPNEEDDEEDGLD
ncbi:hypothetical protein CN198_19150 [Sinorhizobium meliloti]|uniref:hypothetical protein n=1 Tax=Rhizobium meliloti TaxID=382 RepID=UPI000FD4D826|nr:hypothetical protein [Sinorhizobium meliloti]MDW9500253.1 hypothetical protein [Sinorhizobium meliloti]MDW9908568.1 hypothetical protein [Sinorhizobium meliloti]MDX0026930.1 hypothetical protein [Sinorhizobium meliloti]MDX0070420.1 hypothetical protein [Sinorhizobium meliloti]MQV62284.1 hypothetical protein [Sinorhizobium meliloti]